MLPRLIRLCTLFVVLLYSCCITAGAQSSAPPFTRQEVSIGYGISGHNVQGKADPLLPQMNSYGYGPVFHYDLNLSPRLSVEASTAGNGGPTYGGASDGGNEVLFAAGLKATVHRGAWEFFGTVKPGLASFANGVGTYNTDGSIHWYRYTHFALETGVGIQRNLNNRTFLRLDLSAATMAEFDQRLNTQYYQGVVVLYQQSLANVASLPMVSLSIGRRIGPWHTATERRESAPHGSGGAFFPLYARPNLLEQQMQFQPGIGGWVSAAVAPHLDLEAVGANFRRDDHTGDVQDGGRQAFVFGGLKSGFRTDRIGLFAKARFGGVHFSRTYAGDSFATVSDYISNPGHGLWQPALDLGAVVEVYPVRHLVLRSELGPTFIYYRASTLSLQGKTYQYNAEHEASMMLLFGVGLRF